jgi:hypothetical protein
MSQADDQEDKMHNLSQSVSRACDARLAKRGIKAVNWQQAEQDRRVRIRNHSLTTNTPSAINARAETAGTVPAR